MYRNWVRGSNGKQQVRVIESVSSGVLSPPDLSYWLGGPEFPAGCTLWEILLGPRQYSSGMDGIEHAFFGDDHERHFVLFASGAVEILESRCIVEVDLDGISFQNHDI